jgi:hypothetical protein
MISIIALGVFLVIVYWGQIIGWGTSVLTGSSPNALVNSPDLPGLAIAHRLWGSAWVFVLAAMFSSTLAVCARRAITYPPGSGSRWARPARCRNGSAGRTRNTGRR